jgi:ribosomal-protein-alanine N-acetyltransferase
LDDHLILRPWRASDAAIVKAAFDCPDIQRWHTLRLDADAEALDWIAGWRQHWHKEKAASWAVAGRGDDRPVGQIGLRGISLFEAQAGISYWMMPAARGKGIAALALQAVTSWSFDTLGLNRLHLRHSAANLASCGVATKAGYDVEGMMRRSMRHADGWHDMHLHARLKP